MNGINYDLGLILYFYVWIWEYFLYGKSLAVRLDSFVNLLIPINTEAVLRETDSREKPSNKGLKHGAYSTCKYNDARWVT